jgi:hypothetical protein
MVYKKTYFNYNFRLKNNQFKISSLNFDACHQQQSLLLKINLLI